VQEGGRALVAHVAHHVRIENEPHFWRFGGTDGGCQSANQQERPHRVLCGVVYFPGTAKLPYYARRILPNERAMREYEAPVLAQFFASYQKVVMKKRQEIRHVMPDSESHRFRIGTEELPGTARFGTSENDFHQCHA
jgi:hypothetical protein